MASGFGFGFAKLGTADPSASVRLAARCTERRCSQGHCSSAVVVSVREGVAVVATTDGLVIAIMLETLPPESGSGSQLTRVETKAKPGADGSSRSRKASTTGVLGFGMTATGRSYSEALSVVMTTNPSLKRAWLAESGGGRR